MKKLIAVIGIALLAGLGARAKAADHAMTASFLPGLSMPVSGLYASNKNAAGSEDDGVKASFATAVAVDYELRDSLAVGLEIGHDWSHAPKQFPAGYAGDEISLWQVTPYAKYSLKSIGKFTPYGVFGLGLYSFHQNALTINGAEYYGARSLNYLGLNLGVGAIYALAKDWGVGLDLRWHHVFSNIEMLDQSNNTLPHISLNNITPSVKIQYNFSL